MNQKRNENKAMTRQALLNAIELVMKAIGLGSVPMGPVYMSFLTLPIAVGAITMGPKKGRLEFEFYNDEDLTALLDRLEETLKGGSPL